MTDHPEDEAARELLGAYAVNAIDDEAERRAVEDLLRRDPDAVAELRRHEEVLSALAGNLEPVTPPASVWEGTLARIGVTPQEPAEASPVASMSTVRQRRTLRTAIGAAVLVAAAVLAVVLWPRADTAVPARDEVAEAYATPGHRVATLTGATAAGQPISVDVVMTPDGVGMIIASGLPSAGPGHVYQLWAVDGAPVSLGPLGESPATVKFTSEHPVTALALSVESAPAATTPTLPPVAVGSLS